jgi:hypothetical protein
MTILFICKKNECYGFTTYTRRSSGLYNSTRFIVESLSKRGIFASIVEVNDNNDIDREVTKFRPDVVVIEALWVVPPKFDVLKPLHPKVKWFVHLHSHMPFLALEGIAMEWIRAYAKDGIGLIANSQESYDALLCILSQKEIVHLPNVYVPDFRQSEPEDKEWIDIGCFGAVRPLKNQLLQALAAIRFAREKRKFLRFHVNASRIETGGQPVMKNLIQLFQDQPNAELVQSKWNEPEEFLDYLQTMDIGMQVSLTETFNVVTADYVTAGIPIVTSKEVAWVSPKSMAVDDDVNSIVDRMHYAWQRKSLIKANQKLLMKNSMKAQDLWVKFCHAAV